MQKLCMTIMVFLLITSLRAPKFAWAQSREAESFAAIGEVLGNSKILRQNHDPAVTGTNPSVGHSGTHDAMPQLDGVHNNTEQPIGMVDFPRMDGNNMNMLANEMKLLNNHVLDVFFKTGKSLYDCPSIFNVKDGKLSVNYPNDIFFDIAINTPILKNQLDKLGYSYSFYFSVATKLIDINNDFKRIGDVGLGKANPETIGDIVPQAVMGWHIIRGKENIPFQSNIELISKFDNSLIKYEKFNTNQQFQTTAQGYIGRYGFDPHTDIIQRQSTYSSYSNNTFSGKSFSPSINSSINRQLYK